MLAHRPAVRLQRPLQRRGRQPPPLRPRQRRPRDALAGQERHHHVRGDLDRRLVVGVQPQRLLHRCVQPPPRQRQRIARRLPARRRRARARLHLPPAAGQQLAQVHRPRVDVELQRLLGPELGDQPPERARGLLPLGRGHQQRVRRRHPQDPHERALAGHDQPGAVDRLHRRQLARLRQPAGPTLRDSAGDHRLASGCSHSACRSSSSPPTPPARSISTRSTLST